MLTLNPGSVCDVCAEEYGPKRLPHSIPCGHILCMSCCTNIINKTSSRLTPVCPFCREQFTSETVRLIRIDFATSTWNTPRHRAHNLETERINEMVSGQRERFPVNEQGSARIRAEARRLEDKVAKVAAKKCSVEEVSTLHKELQEWLTVEMEDQWQTSLSLSAALLRAILMNHVAHSEASKIAKTTEANLKAKLDDMDVTTGKLEAELRRQRSAYTQTAQECQTLRAEMNRLKLKAGVAAGLGSRPVLVEDAPTRSNTPMPVRSPQSTSPRAMSPTSPRAMSPTSPYMSSASAAQSPLSRFAGAGHHVRSMSTSAGRTQTPGPPLSSRSQTPGIQSPLRSTSTAPTRQRRMSTTASSPQKIVRQTSDDKESIHERWIPSIHPDASSPPSTRRFAYPSHN
ncbi:hypothetical protein FIBSPDRAFT_810514 [Athelia psychrophila]|uniref:RING-type domain-containing protein n=1 Tax=Athelia psychrophila TaxID=1759441 RepID=A0A166WR32_9AGAM|nr:hypothetical protein FIBSPDRAFT_810514 [Fibularhizoctonia sp. CBS 109695]